MGNRRALEHALLRADGAALSSLLERDPRAATAALDGLPPLLVLLRRSTSSPDDVRSCARLLLEAGADPNSHTVEWGGEGKMSALFAAVEGGDVDGVVSLLTDDARLTMPPEPLEYHGPVAIAHFLSTVPAGGHLEMFTLVPTRANGQPAFGCYVCDAQAPIAHAYGLMVLTLSGDRIAAITGFPDTSVFPYFGLPRTLRE